MNKLADPKVGSISKLNELVREFRKDLSRQEQLINEIKVRLEHNMSEQKNTSLDQTTPFQAGKVFSNENQGVHIILDRMEHFPSEFSRPTSSGEEGIWDWLIKAVISRVEHNSKEDKIKYIPELPFLTDSEIYVIYEKFLSLEREAFTRKIVKILSDNDSIDSAIVDEHFAPAWLPTCDDDSSNLLPMLKARKVGANLGTPDIVARLKESWFGRLYVDHLKQRPLLRRFVISAWRNLYPMYARNISIHSRQARRWRPLVRLSEYVDSANIPTIKVFDAEKIDTPTPKVTSTEDQVCLVSPHKYYEFPSIYVAQLSEAQVYGGTNLVFLKETVICHDLYNFELDYTSEELHGRHVLDVKKKRMRLIGIDAAPVELPEAATFLDACAPNYAHWLTEVLPRIAVFCSIKQYEHVPIIIDDGLHRNIMESLALVVGSDREIIALPVGRGINVGTLYLTSVTGYVPFERRNIKLSGHSHGIFSALAFDLLTKQLLKFVDNLSRQDFPERIYLRRRSGARKITNTKEIEQILLDSGYVAVEPEKLTFLQQLALFRSANEIVGPSGAAFANLIFAGSEASVHILIGKYNGTSYWYWQNMACATGKKVLYSLGELSDSQSTIHSDFFINSDKFSMSVSSLRSKT